MPSVLFHYPWFILFGIGVLFKSRNILKLNNFKIIKCNYCIKYLRYSCEASDFNHKRDDTVQNFVKTKVLDQEKLCGIPWTFVKCCERVFQTFIYFHENVVEIQTIFNNLRWHLTVFPSDFNNIYLKYFGILQNLMINYEILWKLAKPTIFHDIFSVKSLAFISFHSIMMYFLHFVISYRDEPNFSVCYCTVSPLDNIGKYFTIVKW